MSKKHCFYYGYSKYELVNKVKQYKDGKDTRNSFNKMYIRIKEPRLVIQEKVIMRHALQRKFVGKIKHDNEKCYIEGKFKYPCFNSLLFVLLGAICLIENTKILLSSASISVKCQVTALFIVAYIFVFLMFFTGRVFYKKQENTVLQILRNL